MMATAATMKILAGSIILSAFILLLFRLSSVQRDWILSSTLRAAQFLGKYCVVLCVLGVSPPFLFHTHSLSSRRQQLGRWSPIEDLLLGLARLWLSLLLPPRAQLPSLFLASPQCVLYVVTDVALLSSLSWLLCFSREVVLRMLRTSPVRSRLLLLCAGARGRKRERERKWKESPTTS